MKLMVMVRNSEFLARVLTTYFAAMPTDTSDDRQLHFGEPIKHALRLFRELLDRSPSSYVQVVAPLAVLRTTINALRASSTAVDDDIETKLAEVESRKDAIFDIKRKGAVLKDDDGTLATRLDRQLQLEAPPDDFRELSVIPTFEDIHTDKEPFLRPNIVRGRYPDVDTYLDVQFRLLREDFVRPLREGISEFLDMRRQELGHDRRLQDIRVYHDVHVVHPICTNSGIVYRIQFDAARLRWVRWRSTKRLIFGSLLCLSKDEFKTMFFATVAESDAKELERGCVMIRFEQNLEAASAISPTETFIMVETSAYFEAYRHVLKGLQEVRQNTMPFTKYIVDCHCANGVNPPAYLRGRFGDVHYDLRALVEAPRQERVRRRVRRRVRPRFGQLVDPDLEESDDSDEEEEVVDVYDGNNPQVANARAVSILREDMWPSADALHLDDSQYQAVKMALTKEFSVIQGPPGTGKTYIGLKIVQALLKNKSVWLTDQDLQNSPTRPILVVCYTNHALDQFLEGISEFYQTGIVRVGSRSQSEKMEKFQLNNIRFRHRASKDVPRYIHEGSIGTREEMKHLEAAMDMAVAQMRSTQRGSLHEYALMHLMDDKHRESLMSMRLVTNDYGWVSVGKRGSVILQWLGLRGNVFILPGGGNQNQKEEKEEEQETGDEDEEEGIDVMGEADFLQDQRLLDNVHDKREKAKREVVSADVHLDLAIDIEALQHEEDQAKQRGQWQVHTSAKKKKQKIKRELSKTDMMTDTEASNVRNVWTLQLLDRWRLYRHWVAKYCAEKKKSIRKHERSYDRAAKRHMEFQRQEESEIMKKATVIGMTTTGAAKYQSVLQDIKPAIIVVEEAAEVLEAHIVTTLSQQCQHLILIGDHQQLRPNPTVYQLAKKYNMDISLFERMVKNDMQCQRLQSQHRMRPEFARLLTPHIYESLDNHESVLNFDNIKGVSSNMFFVDHSYWEAHDSDTKSRSNTHEAQFLAAFCRYLLQQGYRPSQITILTTYTGQLFNFRKVMPRQVFEGVRICAVDNFQGEENDIILLSLVRSNDEGNVGFLKVENRVCVALSRAKKGFYAIGNLTMLSRTNTLWSKIIQELREQGCVGTHLALCCQNHPDTSIMAVTEKDFEKAPEGGCMRPCEFRLLCGHVCASACHPMDPEHREYKCKKPCKNVLCDLDHKCPKFCYEICGSCQVLLEKTIPKCQHKQMVPCSTSPSSFICQIPCEKALPCNHACKNTCGQECTTSCMEVVTHQLTCGHTVQAACSAKDLVCDAPCPQLLKCGHPCAGTCRLCKQGRLHRQCMRQCNRVLECSHQCKGSCTQDCPPCSSPCQNSCPHSRCQHKCGKPCVPCQEPCEWRCKHHKCNKPCGEPCDRPRCNKPCRKTRRCRKCKKDQPCIGMCGEPCPNKCGACDRKELTKIFFGTEDEPGARFAQLRDCGHVLEVNGLDQWMDTIDRNIQLKPCPKCKTPVRSTPRYGKAIKSILVMIEKVKRKRYVPEERREATTKKLLEALESDVDLKYRCHATVIDLHKQVTSCRLSSPEQVAMFEKKVFFLKKIARRKKDMVSLSSFDKHHIPELKREIDELKKWLLRWTDHVSEQEWEEFGREVTRLKFLLKLRLLQKRIRRTQTSLNEMAQANLDSVENRLTRFEPFTEDTEKLVKQDLEKIQEQTPQGSVLEDAGAMSSATLRRRMLLQQASVRQRLGTGDGRSETRAQVRTDPAKLEDHDVEFD
ncbi:PREDICTED: NFX1-type zinc finger-containing protein 1-like [Branchiostoma belcheri]|uniref:NFX1-type zinc finger-containing protein 1-like n=1 Tax=Branchiostoma belcheri TaxID=7741 RepID=A0A6P5A9V6_BRABE|nr:PREDICTED: NFX1-type zinc finger-containing protein 1-like [Branchiostoma belcheri]